VVGGGKRAGELQVGGWGWWGVGGGGVVRVAMRCEVVVGSMS